MNKKITKKEKNSNAAFQHIKALIFKSHMTHVHQKQSCFVLSKKMCTHLSGSKGSGKCIRPSLLLDFTVDLCLHRSPISCLLQATQHLIFQVCVCYNSFPYHGLFFNVHHFKSFILIGIYFKYIFIVFMNQMF